MTLTSKIETRGRSAANAWTDEMRDLCKELHAKGFSASRMMPYFPGKSRNAIMGAWKRLGLCESRPKSILASPKARAAKPPRQPAIALPPASSFLPERPTWQSKVELNPEDENPWAVPQVHNNVTPQDPKAFKAMVEGVVSLMADPKLYGDLLEGECHWPLNVFSEGKELYCGCKALPRLAYCATHSRRSNDRRQDLQRKFKHRPAGKYSRL